LRRSPVCCTPDAYAAPQHDQIGERKVDADADADADAHAVETSSETDRPEANACALLADGPIKRRATGAGMMAAVACPRVSGSPASTPIVAVACQHHRRRIDGRL
jgi:hypothetical protein